MPRLFIVEILILVASNQDKTGCQTPQVELVVRHDALVKVVQSKDDCLVLFAVKRGTTIVGVRVSTEPCHCTVRTAKLAQLSMILSMIMPVQMVRAAVEGVRTRHHFGIFDFAIKVMDRCVPAIDRVLDKGTALFRRPCFYHYY